MVLVLAFPVTVFGILSAQLVFEYVLHLLGRDATLTGRTIIWEGVILSLEGNALLGGGYGAGWEIIGQRLTALTGMEVGHAHNGFLDLTANIGWLGLGLTVSFMLWLGTVSFSNLMKGVQPEISALGLTLVVFSLVGNMAGSFLLLYNSIYWVLLVACFVKLRQAQDLRTLNTDGVAANAPFEAMRVQSS